jgi:undecaprenyl diphosphate synthase
LKLVFAINYGGRVLINLDLDMDGSLNVWKSSIHQYHHCFDHYVEVHHKLISYFDNYGGRAELVQSMKSIYDELQRNGQNSDDIDELMISKHLIYTLF